VRIFNRAAPRPIRAPRSTRSPFAEYSRPPPTSPARPIDRHSARRNRLPNAPSERATRSKDRLEGSKKGNSALPPGGRALRFGAAALKCSAASDTRARGPRHCTSPQYKWGSTGRQPSEYPRTSGCREHRPVRAPPRFRPRRNAPAVSARLRPVALPCSASRTACGSARRSAASRPDDRSPLRNSAPGESTVYRAPHPLYGRSTRAPLVSHPPEVQPRCSEK